MQPAPKIILTLFFCMFCLFTTLGGRTLENTDYFRYAEIGREILELKSWVILHENGEIYVDKPPLHPWNIALSYMVFGVNEFAARFPSALFGLITLCSVLFFTRRHTKSLDAGILSSLILLSSYGFFFFCHRTRIDIEYAAFFTLSLFAFYAGMQARTHRYPLFAVFWLLTGCGFMDKGPVVFLNLVVVIVYWIIARKKGFSYASPRPFMVTLPLVVLPAAPWLYKLFSHPDFQQYAAIFKDANIMRRNEGFFYYIPELVLKFSPAIFFLPVFLKALKKELTHDKDTASLIWFLLVWFSAIFVLLHIPAAKTHRYLLPVFPPLAILAGWGLAIALREGFFKRYLQWPGRVIGVASACFFIAAPLIVWKKHGFNTAPFIISALMLSIICIAWKKRMQEIVLLFLCIPMAYLYQDFFSALRNDKTSEVRDAYEVLAKNGVTADDVVIYKDCGRTRTHLSFYYNKLIACTDTIGGIKRFKAALTMNDTFDEINMDDYRDVSVGRHSHGGRGKTVHMLMKK